MNKALNERLVALALEGNTVAVQLVTLLVGKVRICSLNDTEVATLVEVLGLGRGQHMARANGR